MKKILAIVAIGLLAWYGHQHGWLDKALAQQQPRYSLSTVAENPVPRSDFFELWRGVADQGCDNAKEKHNMAPQACRESIGQKHAACASLAGVDAPQLIGDKALTKSLGRKYLDCVTPHFYCNGVEVRTEDEARLHCSSTER